MIESILIGSVSEAEDILSKAGSEELFEKAKHQVGDVHPNHSNWVWTEWAPGKFDWKSINGKHHKNKATQPSQSKQSSTSSQSIKPSSSQLKDMNYMKQFVGGKITMGDGSVNKITDIETHGNMIDISYKTDKGSEYMVHVNPSNDGGKIAMSPNPNYKASTQSKTTSKVKINSSTIDMTEFLVKENPDLTTAPRKLEDMDDDYLNKLNDHAGKLAFMGSSRHRENFRKWGELIRAEISSRKKQNNKSTKQASKEKTNNFEGYEKKYGTDTSTLEGRMNFWTQSIVGSLKTSGNINQNKFDNLSAELKGYMANPKNNDKDFTLAICNHILNSFTDEQKNKKNLKIKYQTIQKIKNYIENEDYKPYREYKSKPKAS